MTDTRRRSVTDPMLPELIKTSYTVRRYLYKRDPEGKLDRLCNSLDVVVDSEERWVRRKEGGEKVFTVWTKRQTSEWDGRGRGK